MNKEQIINESYENYCKHFTGYDDIPKIDWFIQEIKTSKEFSERWGLKIEEQKLSLDERLNLVKDTKDDKIIVSYSENPGDEWLEGQINEILAYRNVPTKLITITYNNETIESYE